MGEASHSMSLGVSSKSETVLNDSAAGQRSSPRVAFPGQPSGLPTAPRACLPRSRSGRERSRNGGGGSTKWRPMGLNGCI